MAIPSAALAYRRSALMTATKVTTKPPTPEVLRARDDFKDFCVFMGKAPAKHMLEWHAELCTGEDSEVLMGISGPNTAILAPRGPLDPNTLVATPEGWTPLHAISIGDTVYGDDGLCTTVIDTHDYEDTELFEVVFSDGTTMRCDDSHKIDCRRMGTDPKDTYKTRTLQELRCLVTTGMSGNWRTGVKRKTRMAKPGEKPWLDARGSSRYQVPVTKPVRYPEQDLPISPYIVGVLLGDGGLTDKTNVNITTKDSDIIERVNEELDSDLIAVKRSYESRPYSYLIQHSDGKQAATLDGQAGGVKKKIVVDLRQLGMLGKGALDKSIPRSYLHGSISQRVALLQGLMDTDGTRINRNNKLNKDSGLGGLAFGSSSKQLIQDVSELVQSLGGISHHCKPYYPHYYKKNKQGQMIKSMSQNLAYRISIYLPDGISPFHCQRKARTYLGPASARSNRTNVRSIVDIHSVGRSPVRCIEVENQQHRFLIKDYVVSNNSAKSTVLGLFAAWMIGRHTAAKKMLRILYIAYMVDISRAKSATIKGILTSNKYREVFPMVRLSKIKRSDEYWSIDYDFAGIDTAGEEAFTIACGGLKGAITSKRSQLVLIDDPIKSAASINNPDIRREMEQTWSNVIAPTMFQGARAICLGTRFHFDDIHATLFVPKNNWKQIIQKAVITDADGRQRSYWPEFWSMKYLNERKMEDRVAFAYQYLNTAVRNADVGISPELIVKDVVPEDYDCLGVGIDLSAGLSEKNDWTVMTLGGIKDGKIYLIDQRRSRTMGNLEKMDTLCEMLSDWNILLENDEGQWFPTMSPCVIWPEAVAYQTSFEGDFKRVMFDQRALYNLHCSPVKGFKGDKLARLRGVLGLYEHKKVVWNKWRKWNVLEDELLNFGHSQHDDAVDSMVLTMGGLLRRGALQMEFND